MRKIFIIDDDRSICKTLELHLSHKGYRVEWSTTGSEGFEKISREKPCIVILDIRLPDLDGLMLLQRIRELDPHIQVVMITAFQDMETTIKAMQYGAFEYIYKPIDIKELEGVISKIETHLSRQTAMEENGALAAVVKMRKYKEHEIVGKSRPIVEIFKTIGLVSQGRTTVLITGESGTGKELIAKAIHYSSQDHTKPYISVNCSALVETLLESELFGHEKGAFTGALYKKPGKFELANGGTIFLDEIGDMSMDLQVKLLRVLQEKEFERVGGTEKIKIDVRVIAATNRNLEMEVKKNAFREDLYYRLNVVTITVPPLRARKEDIPPLVQHLLSKINYELRKQVWKIPKTTMDMLISYPWPGNVRELENVLTRAVILSHGDALLPDDLVTLLASPLERVAIDSAEQYGHPERDFILPLREIERQYIERALYIKGWNKSKVAESLGISRPRLERKIRLYNLRPQRRVEDKNDHITE